MRKLGYVCNTINLLGAFPEKRGVGLVRRSTIAWWTGMSVSSTCRWLRIAEDLGLVKSTKVPYKAGYAFDYYLTEKGLSFLAEWNKRP